jgi:hypothetical protein
MVGSRSGQVKQKTKELVFAGLTVDSSLFDIRHW